LKHPVYKTFEEIVGSQLTRQLTTSNEAEPTINRWNDALQETSSKKYNFQVARV
jgi:hypothetical protein